MLIELPETRALSNAERLALLERRAQLSAPLLLQRAHLQLALDRPDEALATLARITGEAGGPSPSIVLLTARALRALGDSASRERARDLLAALDLQAMIPALAATVLAEHGELLRSDAAQESASMFEQALVLAPEHSLALKRLALARFAQGRPDILFETCERLIAAGVRTTRLTGTTFAALAALGRLNEARAMRGLETAFGASRLDLSDEDLAAAAQALRDHPARRFENREAASVDTWRIDELAVRDQPALMRLLNAIARAISAFIESLPAGGGAGVLWREARPARARLAAWGLIAEARAHENWHIHDRGWLSGVCYLRVPQALPRGDDLAGAIEFGWPERLLGEGASERFGNHVVHPEPGMVLLFPSHIHHRTWPTGVDEERICVSFDVVGVD